MKSGKLTTFDLRALNAALAYAVALGGLGFGTNAHAATGTDTARATVVTPISITPIGDLRFGAFSTNAAGQTVTINAATSARTNSGTKLVSSANGGIGANGVFGAGAFTITGDATFALTYSITLPADGVVSITAPGGGPTGTMAVHTFTSNPSGTGQLTGGTQTLSVGATLTTVANQASGVYTGNYDVTVEYN